MNSQRAIIRLVALCLAAVFAAVSSPWTAAADTVTRRTLFVTNLAAPNPNPAVIAIRVP